MEGSIFSLCFVFLKTLDHFLSRWFFEGRVRDIEANLSLFHSNSVEKMGH